VDVGVTDAGGGDADEHLAAAGTGEQHGFDRHRAARLAQHRGAHFDRLRDLARRFRRDRGLSRPRGQ
jgi:hypothetical protein